MRVERINYNFDLSILTNTRTAADLSGGGLDAPPLKIGIGANFVIRELVRLGIIEVNKFILPHCFVPKAKARQVMKALGCSGLDKPDYRFSNIIYEFLQEKLPQKDITFDQCFDIPFELYDWQLDLSTYRVADDFHWDHDF